MTPEQMHFFADELREMEKQALLGTAIRGLGSLATRATRSAPAGAGMLSRFKAKISRGIGRGAQGTLNRITSTTMGRSAAPKAFTSMPQGPARTAVQNSWRQALKNRPPPKYSAGAKIVDGVPVPTEATGLQGAANRVGRGIVRSEDAVRHSPITRNFVQGIQDINLTTITSAQDLGLQVGAKLVSSATAGARTGVRRAGGLASSLLDGLSAVA